MWQVVSAGKCGQKVGTTMGRYYYSPWRAPGSAPVMDSCGVAGGRSEPGGFGAQFHNTELAKQGDLGSELPEAGHNYIGHNYYVVYMP